MKTQLLILTSICLVLAACSQNTTEQQVINTPPQTTGNTAAEQIDQQQTADQTEGSVSAEEFASHNTEDNCWVLYEGEVYDVTAWLPKHPGGVKAISRFCGTEGFQEAFTTKHGTWQVDRLHQEARNMGSYAG